MLIFNVTLGIAKSWVSELIQEAHFSAMTKYHFAKWRPLVQSHKCCSAVLTNRWSSGTWCHKGIAEILQGSLCVASHSHPSSQLIRLICTSVTAVNHSGKCFHWSVRVWTVEWEVERESISSRTSVCVCGQTGKAFNICLNSFHPARLTSEIFLSLYF